VKWALGCFSIIYKKTKRENLPRFLRRYTATFETSRWNGAP